MLVISSAAALVLAAATQGWLETEPTLKAAEPLSTVQGTPLPPQALSALHAYRVQDLEVLRFPSADDAAQSWEIRTQQGHGWIDRYSGKLLTWEATGPSQWLYRWARWLHTGEASWLWALVLAGAQLYRPAPVVERTADPKTGSHPSADGAQQPCCAGRHLDFCGQRRPQHLGLCPGPAPGPGGTGPEGSQRRFRAFPAPCRHPAHCDFGGHLWRWSGPPPRPPRAAPVGTTAARRPPIHPHGHPGVW